MLSVRVTAAGAVFVVCLSFLTAPARACDDRFIKKCEKASAAAAAAATEEAATAEPARRSAKRVKLIVSRHAKLPRLAKRTHGPRFAVRSERKFVLASGADQPVRESPLTRRFRGFISPQPLADNAFEVLRKPHAVALDFEPAVTVPASAVAEAEPAAVDATPATRVTTTPKQDRLAAKPAPAAPPAAAAPAAAAPAMELASAESRPITLPDLPPVKPAVATAAIVQPAVLPAAVVVSEAPAAPQPSPFSIHGLVLALCGALGVASALRFIVGA